MNAHPREESNRIETGIGPMTDRFLNNVVERLSTDNFREGVVNRVVDPIFALIRNKLRPYMFGGLILYLVVIILLAFIIYLVFSNRRRLADMSEIITKLASQSTTPGQLGSLKTMASVY